MRHFTAADQGTSLEGLRYPLQALAMLAELSSESGRAEEIALDFDRWCLSVLTHLHGELTVRQRALLNALDAYFGEISGQGGEDLWTEEAIRASEEWSDIRSLARQALGAFGWEAGPLLMVNDPAGRALRCG